MSSVAAELTVSGVVQGVGYRYFCHRRARDLNLTGWVKNNYDGSVSAYVEGDRGLIETFIVDLKTGPSSATVTDINVRWLPFTGKYHSFEVTH